MNGEEHEDKGLKGSGKIKMIVSLQHGLGSSYGKFSGTEVKTVWTET